MLGSLTADTERMSDAVTYSADGTLGCSHVLPQLAADSACYKEQSQIKAILFPNAVPEIFAERGPDGMLGSLRTGEESLQGLALPGRLESGG